MLPAAEMPKLLAAAFKTENSIRPEDVVDLSSLGKGRLGEDAYHIQELFEGTGKGLDNPDIKGTKWAAYNAIVEHLDYGEKNFRGNTPDDSRLSYVWFRAPAIKVKAMNYLLKGS